MKRENVFKAMLFLFLIFLLTVSYFGPCENKIMRCLGGNNISATRTFVHLAIPSVLSLFILFFLSKNIFTKWLKFAVVWIILSLFFILITPVYPGGFMDPNREQVSIWMSGLFLIISLILIIIWHIKERKSLK